jgi:hypothetical protein
MHASSLYLCPIKSSEVQYFKTAHSGPSVPPPLDPSETTDTNKDFLGRIMTPASLQIKHMCQKPRSD